MQQKTIDELKRIDQQVQQINSVFIAAIAGAIALGGTLITQLWGRKEWMWLMLWSIILLLLYIKIGLEV